MLHIPPLLLKLCLEYSGLKGGEKETWLCTVHACRKAYFFVSEGVWVEPIYIACPFKFQFLTVQPTSVSGNV